MLQAKDGESEDDESPGDVREHGILDVRKSIKVSLDESKPQLIQEDLDPVLVENLRDQYLILTNKLLPTAKKWIVILTKAIQSLAVFF